MSLAPIILMGAVYGENLHYGNAVTFAFLANLSGFFILLMIALKIQQWYRYNFYKIRSREEAEAVRNGRPPLHVVCFSSPQLKPK